MVEQLGHGFAFARSSGVANRNLPLPSQTKDGSSDSPTLRRLIADVVLADAKARRASEKRAPYAEAA
jgi:hypothetical protein